MNWREVYEQYVKEYGMTISFEEFVKKYKELLESEE